tara:strand:- start:466 stop:735 length:270 start_codon:yes stop_codon:yes gene_type:complete
MQHKKVTINNSLGLHARPSAKLVELVRQMSSEIKMGHTPTNMCNAQSIFELLKLQAGKGTTLLVSAQGSDEKKAIEDICKLIDSGFGED